MQRGTTAARIAQPMLAAIALAVLAGLLHGAGAGSVAAGPALDWSDPVGITPCESPLVGEPIESGREARRETEGAWRLGPILDDGILVGWDLVTTAPGVRAASLRLPPESAVRGPVDGLLAVVEDDGTESMVSLVAPSLACRQEVGRREEVARQAIWVPSLGALAVHSVQRADRSDAGTWLHDPRGHTAPRRLVPPLAPGDALSEEVGSVWSTELILASSGDQLAVQSCGAHVCRTRIVPLAGGPVQMPVQQPDGPIVALVETRLVGFQACAGLPCPLLASRLDGAGTITLAEDVTSATALQLGGRLVVVATLLEPGHAQLIAIDPADGRSRSLGAVPASLWLVRQGGHSGLGIAVANDHLPMVDQGEGQPFALDVNRLILAGQGETDR